METAALTPIKSSLASHVGYNEKTQKLTVVFPNGARYEYDNVTKFEFDSIMEADSVTGSSIGKRIKEVIKDKKYVKV